MSEYELDHHDYLDEEVNEEKNDELAKAAIWLDGIVGLLEASKAVSLLGQVWSDEQGVFGYEVGRHETIYYKTWYISHSSGDQFHFENMALNSDNAFTRGLVEGLRMLGI